MNALEAMTRLIEHGNDTLRLNSTFGSDTPELSESEESLNLATSVMQAVMNTVIPIARFRAHVTIDKPGPSTKMVMGDFTLCGPSINCIRNGLLGLGHEGCEVHVTLWEQKPLGADMLSGYQGHSKSQQFRTWLKQIDHLETAVAAPAIPEVRDGPQA